MVSQKALLSGRAFEEKVFGLEGFWDKFGPYAEPDYFTFESSLQDIILCNWGMYAHSLERGERYRHNPIDPWMGETRRIWLAVKNFLPSTVRSCDNPPLNLYVSIGRNAFDHFHGVDFFFWWNGVFVTVDITTLKSKNEYNADFLLTQYDLDDRCRLRSFGRGVASLLIEKSGGLTV
ncbi:MAG: hypothetical protein ABL899_02325 [Nitrospira sp.]